MIGENIRKGWKAAGVSQRELAERLQVHQKDISRWENGAHVPTVEMLVKICRELNASADKILELGDCSNVQKWNERKFDRDIANN